MDLKDKELYENVISLLRGGLEIYADESKYETGVGKTSFVDADKGENARFTLNQVDKILKSIESLDNEFDNLIKRGEDQDIDPQTLLKELTRLANEGNIKD